VIITNYIEFKYAAETEYKLGNYKQAMNNINSALDLYPNSLDLLNNKADIHRALGQIEEEKKTILMIIELLPEDLKNTYAKERNVHF